MLLRKGWGRKLKNLSRVFIVEYPFRCLMLGNILRALPRLEITSLLDKLRFLLLTHVLSDILGIIIKSIKVLLFFNNNKKKQPNLSDSGKLIFLVNAVERKLECCRWPFNLNQDCIICKIHAALQNSILAPLTFCAALCACLSLLLINCRDFLKIQYPALSSSSRTLKLSPPSQYDYWISLHA